MYVPDQARHCKSVFIESDSGPRAGISFLPPCTVIAGLTRNLLFVKYCPLILPPEPEST